MGKTVQLYDWPDSQLCLKCTYSEFIGVGSSAICHKIVKIIILWIVQCLKMIVIHGTQKQKLT